MNINRYDIKRLFIFSFTFLLIMPLTISAQSEKVSDDAAIEEVVVTGIKSALARVQRLDHWCNPQFHFIVGL